MSAVPADAPANAAMQGDAAMQGGTLQDLLKVSVVVPTYRRPDLLERCLSALLSQSLAPDAYEIIVADDGPSSDTAELVSRMTRVQGPALLYVPVTATQGPAGARNAGWHTARADLIAFTDDDTQPDPGWLSAGLRAFEHAASPEGIKELGGTQPGGEPRNAARLAAVTGQVVMPLPDKPTDYEMDASGLVRAEFVTANCFVAKWALQEVGGFDERFTLAWREDSDLHFSLISRGYAVRKAADAIVLHPVRPAPPGISVRQQRKVVFDALLYRKHPRLYRQRIRRVPPLDYYVAAASAIVAASAAIGGRPRVALAALAPWLLVTLYLTFRRLRGTTHSPRHVLEMALTSATIPLASVFWRGVASVRHRVLFL